MCIHRRRSALLRTAVAMACAEPRCPNPAISRGRCSVHRQTEADRGYGREWRQVRQAVRSEERVCRNCGSSVDLTVDHIRPQSLGGTNVRTNLRVLCRSCHASIGVKA